MPLVAHNQLPTFERLVADGFEVLSTDRAAHQDIREQHIGLLNMMPDSALQATERQFLRMLTSCNQIAQFYIHPFSIPGIQRSKASQAYIDRYYQSFDQIKSQGLDALIITGANPSKAELNQEDYWPGVIEVFEWAKQNVASTLCSCLASHAAFKQFYNIERKRLINGKCWGVYSHRIVQPKHPLVSNVNTRFDVPHSRFNEVTRDQLEYAGLHVLVESRLAGVHMAVSKDLFRVVYLQGHPEYNFNSLLKEYKREIERYMDDERHDYPPVPANYFNQPAMPILSAYQGLVESAKKTNQVMPAFPEAQLETQIDNTWWDTGKAIFNNWLGLVYQKTNIDRKKLFMEGVDPDNPLAIRLD